jgi:hypothetical protein
MRFFTPLFQILIYTYRFVNDKKLAIQIILIRLQDKNYSAYHKVLKYVEYRAVSGVFQNIDPPGPHPLYTQRECPFPAPKAGGYKFAGR